MKKIVALFLVCLIFIPALSSCADEPPVTSDTVRKIDTLPDEPETEAETEPETEPQITEPEETEPLISEYGIFTRSPDLGGIVVSSPYAILIDADNSEILYMNCEPDEKLYPASTTKLLTALVALKYCDPDDVFKAGDELELLKKGSTTAYIKEKAGHKLTVSMLIEGMMLPSGGDAAYVLAAGAGRKIAHDGTLTGKQAVAVFVEEMNRYATDELYLQNSHFTCPDGDHDEDHYTTIIDIMTVAKAAMAEPLIMQYARLQKDDVKYASGHTNSWENTNLLLDPSSKYYYKYAIGLKTGTTEEAGNCLISVAEKDGKTVLVGVFGAKEKDARYTDSLTLLKIGIER